MLLIQMVTLPSEPEIRANLTQLELPAGLGGLSAEIVTKLIGRAGASVTVGETVAFILESLIQIATERNLGAERANALYRQAEQVFQALVPDKEINSQVHIFVSVG